MQIFASDNKLEISAVAVWLILYKTSQLNISSFFHTPNFRSPVTYFYFLQNLKAHHLLDVCKLPMVAKRRKKIHTNSIVQCILSTTYYYIAYQNCFICKFQHVKCKFFLQVWLVKCLVVTNNIECYMILVFYNNTFLVNNELENNGTDRLQLF